MEVDAAEMTIGELARLANVTPRAIRHYEAVGLLAPAERSYGGHRRYTGADRERLELILALRRLGFGLRAIDSLLEPGSRGEALAVARRRLERAEIEAAVADRLRVRLERFVGMLEATERRPIDELIADMEVEVMDVTLDEISTRLGDAGETDLADGSRVAKTDPVLAAVGAVEELGAQIGLLLAEAGPEYGDRLRLERIANDLFDLGSDLSSPPREGERRPRTSARYVDWLEEVCEEAKGGLDPLDSFVAWFGSPVAARLNVCRVICRRAERAAFAVEEANPQVGRYLNRLSDVFFLLARAAAVGQETLWEPGRSSR